MKTFKNTNFTKRNSEATNLVFCQATEAPAINQSLEVIPLNAENDHVLNGTPS